LTCISQNFNDRRARVAHITNWQLLESSCFAMENSASEAGVVSYLVAQSEHWAIWLDCSQTTYTIRRCAPATLFRPEPLTLAMPISAGETWTASVFGIPLDGITLRFE
jgi:hypothetical protein